MRTLRFHNDVYSAHAIEDARQAFANHASIEVRQEMPYFELDLKAIGDDDETVLAGEFANYALALTVEEKRGATSG